MIASAFALAFICDSAKHVPVVAGRGRDAGILAKLARILNSLKLY